MDSKLFPNGVHGHIVRMTREYPTDGDWSVATCECGWKNRVLVGWWEAQDDAVDAHWKSAVATSGAQPRAPR